MRFPSRPLRVSLGFAIIVLATVSAQSAVLIVTNTQDFGADSLRAAVAVAAVGDTIEFNIPTSDPGYNVATGVFTITLLSGEIVIDKDLNIAAPGERIAISGNHAGRIFHITNGNVAISAISLIDGTAKGTDGPFDDDGSPGIGGAILNQGTLVFKGCTFKSNTALGGRGGSGTQAGKGGDGLGGAIANQANLSLVACTVADNSALGGPGGTFVHTGIHSGGATGGAGSGGAIHNSATGTLSLSNCTITSNTSVGADARQFGDTSSQGAAAQGGGVANFGNVSIVHCTLANNSASGGDAYTASIFGPYDGAPSSGGGIYSASGSVLVTRDTIFAPNIAVGGAGGGAPATDGAATGQDVNAAITSQGHNLFGRSDGCSGITTDDLQGGTTDATRLDPKLGTLGNYGGPTETLPLLPDSPAIDAGSAAAPTRDQRSYLRSGPPDIGAFEYQGRQPAPLANISTRLRVQPDDNAMIGGFIITGAEPKTVIIRGIGPSLPVTGALADPVIEVHGSAGEILSTNDNWRDAATRQEIIGSGLSPANDLESSFWGALAPGSYTVVVRGAGNTVGTGLFEVYDLDQTVDSKLANISTRGFVGTGDDVMIGGTIIVGGPPAKVLFRAIGPSLMNFGVTNALADPVVALYDGNGQLLAINYDWRDDQEAEINATGLPPSNNLESAIVRDLAPGNYTAIVRGFNNTTGVALVEVYNLN
ncbi:MAG TPA: choice-of-anchor Q domain-containing protein [Chthoniobacterales bacterium]|nr:choice-of-anchor Q domain-containing protein [Chthoniobacterales bacterium]